MEYINCYRENVFLGWTVIACEDSLVLTGKPASADCLIAMKALYQFNLKPWTSCFGDQWNAQQIISDHRTQSKPVPQGLRLVSQSVQGSYLARNLSEAFCYNFLKLGHVSFYFGLVHQIKQEVKNTFFFSCFDVGLCARLKHTFWYFL